MSIDKIGIPSGWEECAALAWTTLEKGGEMRSLARILHPSMYCRIYHSIYDDNATWGPYDWSLSPEDVA